MPLPGSRIEATLTPDGRLHFWAPAVPPAKIAGWVRERVGDRWPGPEDPAALASEPARDGVPAPGLGLEPLAAATTLAATVPPADAPDTRAASLRFWDLACRFLFGLLSRGRFRPSVRGSGGKSVSVWQVDFAAQQRALDALRLAAPERALFGLDPETAISEYLVRLGDTVVRDAGRRLGWSLPAEPPPDARPVEIPGANPDAIGAALDDLFAGFSRGFGSAGGDGARRADRALRARPEGRSDAAAGAARLVFALEPPEAGADSDPEAGPKAADTESWRIRFLLAEPDSGAVSTPDSEPGSGNAGLAAPEGANGAAAEGGLVPLREIWRADNAAANIRRFGAADPAILLLDSLGRAAKACPILERGLAAPAPEGVAVSLSEAYEFLHEGQDALVREGFEVRIPPSLAGKRARTPTLRLTVRPLGPRDGRRTGAPDLTPAGRRPGAADGADPGGLGLDALVDYRWQVAIGDHSWSLDEFRRLTRGKRRLLRASEGWVALDPEAMNRLFGEAARRRAHAGRSPVLRDALRERLRLAPPSRNLFEADDAPVVSRIEGEAWIGSLFAALEAAADELGPLDPPAGLRTELRPYQRVGYGWLRLLADHGLGGCLADDMGLGKTCQALTFLLGEQEAGRLTRPWLLVCPNSIVANWRKEAERFAPSLRLQVRRGAGRSRGADFGRDLRESDLLICSFGIVHRDLEELREVSWGGLIIDEAQNLKNPGAKQTRAIRRLKAPIRFALTGTPLENRLTDLWSIMEVLNPGFLGPERTFRRTFSAAVEDARDREATAQLRRLVRPFILRRLKTDPKVIRDLPEKHQTRVYCNLTPEQASLYQAAVDRCLERIARNTGFARRGEILRTLTRLKQICNHPENLLRAGGPLAGRSGKLTRLVEILTEVRQREERALVFTQFAEMAKLLARHLAEVFDAEIPVLHGAVSIPERDAIVTRFQEAPDPPPVLVLSLRTGGYGLNLTRASHVAHYDRWWNPAVENQATDRAFRIGQRRRVLVHKFLCTGTLEERIADLLERKSALAESVIGTGEGWLTSLSEEALQDVLALGPEAVSP